MSIEKGETARVMLSLLDLDGLSVALILHFRQ